MSSSKRFNWNLAFLILLYIISFMWAGLSEFVRTGFDSTILFTPTWWGSVFEQIALNHLVLLGTIFYLLGELQKKDQEILDAQKYITKVVDEQVHPVTFNPFMHRYNRNRKIKKYRSWIKRKLDKLEDKAKMHDIDSWESGSESRAKNKYSRTRIMLEKRYEDEYIEKYIASIKVPGYTPIQKTFVTNGYTSRGNQDEDDNAPENGAWKMFNDLWPRIAISIGLITALQTIIIEAVATDDWKVAVISTFAHITPLIVQVFIARSYAQRYRDEKILVDFRKRKEIIAEYISEQKSNKEVKHNGGYETLE
jgi:hypothetical protein